MLNKNVIAILIKADDKASAQIGLVSGKLGSLNAQLTQGAKVAATAGLAVTAAIGGIIISTAKWSEKLAKYSKQFGVSTEFLSEFDHALRLVGTDINSAYMGFKKLAKSASDTSFGLMTYKRIYDDLGISVRNADGSLKGIDQLLYEIADAFKNTTDETKKLAYANDLLGRQGATLIPLLNEGSEGIKKYMEESKKLGHSLSIDAAGGAEELIDSFERIRTSLRGVGLIVMEELQEPITEFTNKIATETIPRMGDFLRENKGVVGGVAKTSLGVTLLSFAFLGLTKVIAAAAAHPVIGAVILGLGMMAKMFKESADRTYEAKKALEDFGDTPEVREQFEKIAYLAGMNKREVDKYVDSIIDAYHSEKRLVSSTEERAKGLDLVGEAVSRLTGSYEEMFDRIAEQDYGVKLSAEELAAVRTTNHEQEKAQIEEIIRLLKKKALAEKYKGLVFKIPEPVEPTMEGEDKGIIETFEEIPELVNPAAEALTNFYDNAKLNSWDFAYAAINGMEYMVDAFMFNFDEIEEAWESMIKGMIAGFIKLAIRTAAIRFFTRALGLPFGKGGEITLSGGGDGGIAYAQHGLEVLGGLTGGDTIPAFLRHNEVVIPSPTVDALREFLEGQSGGGRASRPINVYPLFTTGSDYDSFRIAEFISEKIGNFDPFTVEGSF